MFCSPQWQDLDCASKVQNSTGVQLIHRPLQDGLYFAVKSVTPLKKQCRSWSLWLPSLTGHKEPPSSAHRQLACQLKESLGHREDLLGDQHVPQHGVTILRSKKEQWGHLLSDEGNGVWEVGLEKIQYLLSSH